MDQAKARDVVSVRIRLPRSAWPVRPRPAVRLVRGRWTSRQAVLLLRVEGSLGEVRAALRFWARRGFVVKEGGGLERRGRGALPGFAM